MFAGWNLIVDEENTPMELVHLEPCRQPSNLMGYTHGNRMFLRPPICPVCEDIEPAYCVSAKDAFRSGNWIARVAHGNSDETFPVLLEHEYSLEPAYAVDRAFAIEMAMEMLAEMVDHETETVVVESFSDDYVSFRVEKNGEVVMHLDLHEVDEKFFQEMLDEYIESVNALADPEGIELEEGFEKLCACDAIYAHMTETGADEDLGDCGCGCDCDCEDCCPGCDGHCYDDEDEDDEDDDDFDDDDDDEEED